MVSQSPLDFSPFMTTRSSTSCKNITSEPEPRHRMERIRFMPLVPRNLPSTLLVIACIKRNTCFPFVQFQPQHWVNQHTLRNSKSSESAFLTRHFSPIFPNYVPQCQSISLSYSMLLYQPMMASTKSDGCGPW